MKILREKWDKKARHYNRYTDDHEVLEAHICRHIQEAGVDFSDKNILDIGCGTGVYTLRFAQKARNVDAVDISPAMLKILNEDARNIGLHTITTYQSSWEDFVLTHTYDIAIATMFPALKEHAHFQKMHDAAPTKLFLGWGGKQGTELIEALFREHGGIYRPPNSATILKQWLDTHQIPHTLIAHTEEKVKKSLFAEAVEKYSWHLKVRGIVPQKEKISSVLQAYQDRKGIVVERTRNYLNLIIW